jgi:hypothetical protein
VDKMLRLDPAFSFDLFKTCTTKMQNYGHIKSGKIDIRCNIIYF